MIPCSARDHSWPYRASQILIAVAKIFWTSRPWIPDAAPHCRQAGARSPDHVATWRGITVARYECTARWNTRYTNYGLCYFVDGYSIAVNVVYVHFWFMNDMLSKYKFKNIISDVAVAIIPLAAVLARYISFFYPLTMKLMSQIDLDWHIIHCGSILQSVIHYEVSKTILLQTLCLYVDLRC